MIAAQLWKFAINFCFRSSFFSGANFQKLATDGKFEMPRLKQFDAGQIKFNIFHLEHRGLQVQKFFLLLLVL